MLVDGPSPEHELVLQGRLEGQAPDIDSVVYLTDCDPAAFDAGDLIRARIVGARGYDLVAAPVQPARLGEHRSGRDRAVAPDAVRRALCYIDGWQLRVRSTRVGLCPLFVFRGGFSRAWTRGAGTLSRMSSERLTTIRAAAERVAQSYGLEIFDVQLRRESIGTVLRVMIDRPDRGVPETAGRRGRHRGLPARQPGPERAPRRRGRGTGRGGARPALHAGSVVAGAGSAAPARGGLPPLRGPAGQDRDDGADRRPVGVLRDASSASNEGDAWSSKRAARRTGCRSRGSSAGTWLWNFECVASAVSGLQRCGCETRRADEDADS